MRVYAIGDIHGHLGLLKQVHARIAADRAAVGDAGAPVVHVGDLVDRGPDSKGVIDHLIARRDAGEPDVVLMGNHDQMMQDFLSPVRWYEKSPAAHWLNPGIGGRETLASYGIDTATRRGSRTLRREALARIPETHLDFLDGLRLYHREGNCFFCHAGVRPGVPLDLQAPRDLVWIRHEFLDDTRDHGALVVHGHTPTDAVTHWGNRLELDTGAAYGGPLSAVVIEDDAVWLLGENGRESVRRC